LRILVTGAAGFIGSFVRLDCWIAATKSRGSTISTTITTSRSSRPGSNACKPETDSTSLALILLTRPAWRNCSRAAGFSGWCTWERRRRAILAGGSPQLHQQQCPGHAQRPGGCRHHAVEHLVYASTSSVYGASTRMPFSEHEPASHPLSLYAASKRSTELMAHNYSALFGLPTTGLRFFTVYGPWGRPDMALFLFARAIIDGRPIRLFNHGHHSATSPTWRTSRRRPASDRPDSRTQSNWDSSNPDPASSSAPYRIYNIGSNRPIQLLRYIEVLEDCLGRKASACWNPYSWAMCPIPSPMSANSWPLSATSRIRPSKSVCGTSSTGSAATISASHQLSATNCQPPTVSHQLSARNY